MRRGPDDVQRLAPVLGTVAGSITFTTSVVSTGPTRTISSNPTVVLPVTVTAERAKVGTVSRRWAARPTHSRIPLDRSSRSALRSGASARKTCGIRGVGSVIASYPHGGGGRRLLGSDARRSPNESRPMVAPPANVTLVAALKMSSHTSFL